MGKANISFPEGMLEDIDRRARASGTTRSGFVQEATVRYMAQLDHDSEVSLRTARIEATIASFRGLSMAIPPGPAAVELIREIRAVDDGRLHERGDAGPRDD